ncbi:hypothetical protein ACJIZ3_010948 [Penstemon smallii]|uniref:F-box domain-containing protein n=1 Tax=Penstemon smallii TaxID=265156 RepID=A0ABD3UHR3_9LAMI
MYLPEDIILEILSRLPVKSLIRFRCVCKSWNTLPNNSRFITNHFRTFSSIEGSEFLLVSRREVTTNKRVVSLMKNDGNDTFVDQNLQLFLNVEFGHVRLIGPCNGVICLYGFPDNIALWNPMLRDFKILPRSQVPRPSGSKVRGGDLGFGFDSTTRTFKVMQILFCISTDRLIYHVEIYYSNTNSWRKFERVIPANIMFINIWSMVYKNETFCWWANDWENYDEMILSFDMRKEIFKKTPFPCGIEVIGGENKKTRAILPIKESISLIVYSTKKIDKVFDIWIMNELGENREGWIKVSSIGPISGVERPLGFWNVNEFVLESSGGELIMYDPKNRNIKKYGIYGKRNRLEALVYKESLFPVNEDYANL